MERRTRQAIASERDMPSHIAQPRSIYLSAKTAGSFRSVMIHMGLPARIADD